MEEQEQVLGEYSEHITVAQLRKFYKKFKIAISHYKHLFLILILL